MKGLIFDLDGTLWDSSKQVADSWTEALAMMGKKKVITIEDMQRVMGKTMDQIADMLFADEPMQERYDTLKRCMDYENDYVRKHGGVLYPRVEETLIELKKKYKLFIVSNCQCGYIEAFLGHYGFEKYFEDIQCFGDNGLPKGKNIRILFDRNDLEDAAYIGDIQGDYDATMEAELAFIHAAYGFGTINHQVPKLKEFAELVTVADQVLG